MIVFSIVAIGILGVLTFAGKLTNEQFMTGLGLILSFLSGTVLSKKYF